MKLIESTAFEGYTIEPITESANGARLVVRGKFGEADQKNDNGRVYPRAVWEHVLRENSEAMRRVRSRNMFGEVDHPDDGRTLLARTSHIVTELGIRPDGAVMGAAEILPTPSGKILEALFNSGTLVGISSRGEGDLQKNGSGADVVQEGYNLQAFDFVHNPSTSGAYPRPPALESKEGILSMDILSQYSQLEESVLELSRLNVSDLTPDVRRVVEAQANETLTSLSKLVQEAGDHKPLVAGLMSEFQPVRRRLLYVPESTSVTTEASVNEEDYPPLPHMDKLLKSTKSDTDVLGSSAGGSNPEQLPASVPPKSVQLIPGSEKFQQLVGEMEDEEDIDMAEAKKNDFLRALVQEADAAFASVALEEGQGRAQQVANAVARRCESRLLSQTRGIMNEMGDPMPAAYEPTSETGMQSVGEEEETDIGLEPGTMGEAVGDFNEMEGDEEEEMAYEMEGDPEMSDEAPVEMAYEQEGDEEVDVPEPPAELTQEPTEEEDEDEELPPMEARVRRYLRAAIYEMKKARYEKTVTEAIAANSIAKLSRRVRYTEAVANRAIAEARKPRNTFVEANGQRIPVRHAGQVIESLIERYHALEGNLTESSTLTESHEAEGPFGDITESSAANVRDLNTQLLESDRPTPSSNSASSSLLESQALLGAKVAARIGRN